jgi:signal transduction histidine kinase
VNERGLVDVREVDVRRELHRLRRDVADLRASRMRLALADDAERRRFERVLHEGVQQLLVTLATDIELATASMDSDPTAAKTLLAETRRDVQQALEETRKLADRIYPPLVDAGALTAALRSAAARAGFTIRIDVDMGRACPPEIARTAYLVCLDVLDRAEAGTMVDVSVLQVEGNLAFDIAADDAVDAESQARDRVEALGGRLAVQQGPGRQTRVVGSLPLSR